MGIKRAFKDFWHFLWEEESFASWVVNVVIAFVVIKYLLYPGLGFVLGTPAPIVAVVSGSMEHDSGFDDFWSGDSCCNDACSRSEVQGAFYESVDISRGEFRDFPFVNGFNKGDIMILAGADEAVVGDVIVYLSPIRPDPIIHRVIKVSSENDNNLYWTKGDHNCDIGSFEEHIPQNRVIGKAVWRVPLLGWVKIFAVWFWQLITGW